jgi:hypothetical protein
MTMTRSKMGLKKIIETNAGLFDRVMASTRVLKRIVDRADSIRVDGEHTLILAKNHADWMLCRYTESRTKITFAMNACKHNIAAIKRDMANYRRCTNAIPPLKYGRRVLRDRDEILDALDVALYQFQGYMMHYNSQGILLRIMHIRILQICRSLGVTVR